MVTGGVGAKKVSFCRGGQAMKPDSGTVFAHTLHTTPHGFQQIK
jgi:hypothetical protein